MSCDISALRRARARMDAMFGLVQPDSLYERPIPPRHRIVFYIGHVEAFDKNLLGAPSFAPDLDRLFAFGIDPPPGEMPNDGPDSWPELARVYEYRDRTRQRVDAAWHDAPEQKRHVAVEHRLMHAETLAYMLHGMDTARLVRPQPPPHEDGPKPESSMIPILAGEARLGQHDADDFGWDNEFRPYHVAVPSFQVDRYPITNRQWLQFVEAGGTPPHFWRQNGGKGWRLRTFFDEIPLPMNWPVYVTQRQASHYARWRNAKLPSEAQWQRAAYGDQPCRYPWGNAMPGVTRGNFDSYRFDPVSVAAHPESASSYGAEDLLGNGWEWTSTPFRPFPGFEPFAFYKGYSSDFFDDDHFVLKGGSPRTDAAFLRSSFRNWFRSDYPYVYATFRCIHDS
jgi:formylglycine-generating enzyme required for sulfatase activity